MTLPFFVPLAYWGGVDHGPLAILAGMLGVSAMAVQNALVQISLKGAPSTAVMTSNVTRFAIDVGEVLLRGDPADVAKARNRAARTLPVIVGFAVGCGLGAACEAALGLWSLALPAGLALLAFAMGFAAERDGEGAHEPSQTDTSIIDKGVST